MFQKPISLLRQKLQDIICLIKKTTQSTIFDQKNLLVPNASGSVTPTHDEHLESLDPISELVVFAGQSLVLLLKVGNVFGCLAEDGGLVELVSGGKSTEILLAKFLLNLVRILSLQTVDHDAESRHRVTEGSDLIVEVCAVSLLNHVVGRLLGRRAVTALCRRGRHGGSRREGTRARRLALSRRVTTTGVLHVGTPLHVSGVGHDGSVELGRLRRDG